MSWIKVIFINVILTFALLGIFLLMPPLVYSGHQFLESDDLLTSYDRRSDLSLYSNYDWADTHFKEFGELPTTYYDFITWRRDNYEGITVNIQDGLRRTSNNQRVDRAESEFWFFGGSTTWGTGVNDEYTYPSLFALSTAHQVTNFGETGYIARQSLAYLINHIIQKQIKDMSDINVVFYDGVNDVAERCRSEIIGLGTGRENQIQKKIVLDPDSRARFGFSRTFDQLQVFLGVALNRLFPKTLEVAASESMYNCVSDVDRAYEVAQSLVNTWEIASDFVNSRGGNFTAILQPVSYYGNAEFSYLELTSPNDISLAAQFRAVYPLLIEIANSRNINFIDLTSVYDGCSDCYIDFCHVGPQANEILNNKIVSLLNE